MKKNKKADEQFLAESIMATKDFVSFVDYIEKNKCNGNTIFTYDNSYWSILMLAIGLDFNEAVDLLLDSNNCEAKTEKINLNYKNNEGYNALLVAVQNENIRLVKKILQFGADPNIQTNYGLTPLMCACELGNNKLVKILLDNGAIPTIKDQKGKICLDFAYKKEHYDTVNYFNSILLNNSLPMANTKARTGFI